MRPIRLIILATALVGFAGGASAMASTANDPARISLPAATSLGCPAGGVATEKRGAPGDDLSRNWDRKRHEAFGRLLVAAERYVTAVALHETDHSFTADKCDISKAQAAERHVFRRTLETLVADADSSAPLMTAREADGALDAAYNEVMAVEGPQNLAWGSVEKAGIRKAERAWLAYRDAFVVFAATFETPGVAERIRIELTARRAASLEAFLAD